MNFSIRRVGTGTELLFGNDVILTMGDLNKTEEEMVHRLHGYLLSDLDETPKIIENTENIQEKEKLKEDLVYSKKVFDNTSEYLSQRGLI